MHGYNLKNKLVCIKKPKGDFDFIVGLKNNGTKIKHFF